MRYVFVRTKLGNLRRRLFVGLDVILHRSKGLIIKEITAGPKSTPGSFLFYTFYYSFFIFILIFILNYE